VRAAAFAASAALVLLLATQASAQTPHDLSAGDYVQTFEDDIDGAVLFEWNDASSMIGFSVNFGATPPDPATYLTTAGLAETLIPNVANPDAPSAPFATFPFPFVEIPDFSATPDGSGILLVGPGVQELAVLMVRLDSRDRRDLTVDLTFLDGAADTTGRETVAQLQYRIGGAGNFINVPAGRADDITTGGGAGAASTLGSRSGAGGAIPLPSAADDQALVEVRLVIGSPDGAAESFTIDDVEVRSSPLAAVPGGPLGASLPGWTALVMALLMLAGLAWRARAERVG